MFDEIIDKGDTIFICGEEEELRSETLDPLLASKIAHFYFIKPKENLKNYLASIAEPHLFSFVESLDEIDLTGKQIIACGFKPVARNVIATFQQYQPSGVIFFDGKLGLFKPNWSAIASLKIIEQSLERYVADYVAKHAKRALYKSSDLIDKEGEFFTNRGEMLDLHREFITKQGLRCCKIVGLKGIGKRAFIRRLKFVMGLSENCIEIGFTDNTDDINYLLGQLLRKFGIVYEDRELEQFHGRRILPVVEKLFTEFDRIKNAKLIFYRIDAIYDSAKKHFYDAAIETFFHQLLQRESYPKSHNRVYMIANENFNFASYDDRNVTYAIQLNPIHPEHILYILEHEFNSRGKTESAQAIMKYDYDTIHKLLGGHPQIAKLFVEACEHFPMESIINDPEFRQKFDAEKADYLMQHIHLSGDEHRLLSYLALFTTYFLFDAIKALEPKPYTLIEQLRDKFLLEKEDFDDGHSEYYVPSIIQDYARAKTDEATRRKYHNQIAYYYRAKAEDLKTPPPDMLEAYRLALYHFSEARNTPQEKQLAAYFKGIFLKKAREAYHKKEYKFAWNYYRELFHQAELSPKNAHWYLICHSILKKDGAEQLYEQIMRQYPDDRFIKTSYAEYLLKQGDDAQAAQVCAQVLKDFPNDKVAHKLHARILQKGALYVETPLSTSPTTDDLGEGERDRLAKELDQMQEQYELYSAKVHRLEKALAIETDPSVKFKIEEDLKSPKAKQAELAEKMREIESILEG